MDFVSEKMRGGLGEEDETQLSSASGHTGRERYSHPWLPRVEGTAFQRHRSGFQGEVAPVPRLTAESMRCASFPSIHGAERSRGRKRPPGSQLGERSRVLAFSIPVERAVGTEDVFGRNLWSQIQK